MKSANNRTGRFSIDVEIPRGIKAVDYAKTIRAILENKDIKCQLQELTNIKQGGFKKRG